MSTPAGLTEQQHAALATRDVSVALDAGAGCGKTFVLTERFLSHLDPTRDDAPPARLDELVAITFTDPAAREMRSRIRAACRDRLRAAGPETAGYWLALLRSIDAARINTIHGFCSTLVRTHALELGLDPQFQVLDGGATDVLRSESTDASLRRRLADRDPLTLALAARFDLAGLKQRLAGLVAHHGEPAFAAWREGAAADSVDAWRTAYVSDYLPRWRRRLVDLDAFAELAELLPQATPAGPEFAETRDRLFDLTVHLRDGEPTHADFAQLHDLARVQRVCKAVDWPDKETFDAYKHACKAVRNLADKVKPLAADDELAAAAQTAHDVLGLAAELADDYRLAKRERGELDFEDLLSEARRLLTQPEFADAQRELQQQLRLLLVDEFQDTDSTQVAIVKALVGDELEAGRLFFVGDFKQSIYRFRGAEPGVFRRLQGETPSRGRLPLARNFRSQPAVLDFVNQLFASVFGADYTPLEAARPQVSPTPAVEFLWTPVADKALADASRQAEARSIARRVRQLIDERAEIVGERDAGGDWRPRAVEPGDVAILFRALSDVQHYEQALRDEGFEYYLVGGRAFYSQQEVYDVANLLRAVGSTCDEVALAGVLRSPFFTLHDETLYWLAMRDGLAVGFARDDTPPELADEERAKLRHARQTLAALREQKGRATVAELLVDAIARTAYDAVLLAEFLGERKAANVEKLVEQARVMDAYRPGDLDGFVRQLTEFIAREPKEALAATRTGAKNEVRLMTVHAAKGLEFPVVVLADGGRVSQGKASPVAFSEELGPMIRAEDDDRSAVTGIDLYRDAESSADAEELDRLFYVACTRAADHLIVSASRPESGRVKGDWLKTLATGFDLESGRPIDGAGDASLVTVTPADSRASNDRRARGVDRLRLVEQAAGASAAAPPEAVLPLAFDRAAVERFSVSRITGQLQHATRRPAAVGVGAALADARDEVDPLGLGALVHAVIERLSLAPAGGEQAGSYGRAINQWCQSLAPLHFNRQVGEAAALAEELVTRFVASTRFASMRAASRVEREVEFLLRWPPRRGASDGGAYLQGYIDCLLEEGDTDGRGVTILDFKTNRVDADGVQALAEQYRLQLAVYAMAVEQATGVPPRELCLCFLRPGVEVQFEWNDATRAETTALVDQAIAGVRVEAAQQWRKQQQAAGWRFD